MHEPNDTPRPSQGTGQTDGTGAPRVANEPPLYASMQLMADHQEIRISHEGVTYRLRRTATGKLVLTK